MTERESERGKAKLEVDRTSVAETGREREGQALIGIQKVKTVMTSADGTLHSVAVLRQLTPLSF